MYNTSERYRSFMESMSRLWDAFSVMVKNAAEAFIERLGRYFHKDALLDKEVKKKDKVKHPANTTITYTKRIQSQVIINKPLMIRVRTNC